LVFDEVQTELEAEGYEVLPFLLPACAVNAPHRRDRIWFVANTSSIGFRKHGEGERLQFKTLGTQFGMDNENAANTNSTNNKTRAYRKILGQPNREKTNGFSNVECRNKWESFPTQSPVCGGDDGIPRELDNITFSKWRNESIKAYGNAIVPQVAYQIFKSICQYQEL
jgi:DNA (cytosine-5)-methyltransferase 1